MRRSLARVSVGLACLIGLASGCGQDPFGAPPRPRTAATTEEVEPAKSIYFVTPSVPEGSVELWEIEAHREANGERAIFRAMSPDPDDPKSTEVDVIRKAMADGASALVVVPGDVPGLAEALAEAEAKKVPVVLLGRSIAAPSGSAPFTAVVPGPIEEVARQLVRTTLEDAKKQGRPANGSALILASKVTDAHSPVRVAALKAAAQSAGLSRVEDLTVDPPSIAESTAAVTEAIKALPDVAIVLGADDSAVILAAKVRAEFKGNPAFYVGGFAGYRGGPISSLMTRESCWVEAKHEEQARQAVRAAFARLRGDNVATRIEQPSKFNRGAATLAVESSPGGAIPRTSGEPPKFEKPTPPTEAAKP